MINLFCTKRCYLTTLIFKQLVTLDLAIMQHYLATMIFRGTGRGNYYSSTSFSRHNNLHTYQKGYTNNIMLINQKLSEIL